MTPKIPANTGKDAFIAELVKFRTECGNPSYQQLADLSERLPQLYPSPAEATGRHVTLSVTALSSTLKGRRKNMPAFNWVASFVLCCQRWAYEARATDTDPGTATLGGWLTQWADHAKSPGPHPCPSLAEPAPGDGSPAEQTENGRTRPLEIPPGQHEFVAGHGAYGRILLSQASTGSAEALYRIALLLATGPAWQAKASGLLIYAAAAGHGPSLELLSANHGDLPPSQAAGHALRLAQAADAEGRRDEADAFYRAAARDSAPESTR
jgi:hypothetical protein